MSSFGENLRRERELRGVDLHEMAEATKISIRFLQALEQDRVDVLPGGMFPRAFVRQYGKYLGLDPERLVAEFVFAFGGDPVPARVPVSEVHVDRSNRWWMIGAAALLIVAFLGWKMWGRPSSDAQAEAPVASAPPQTFPQDRVYPPPSAAGGQAPAGVVVGLTVRKRSWVEAKVDGTTVLSRLMDEGETHRLDAREAVTLSLGNAGGVEYSLNGRPPASLGRDGEVRRNVVITAAGPAAGSAFPPPIRASSPRPRRPSPSPVPQEEEAPAVEPSPAPSPGPAA